MRFRRHILAVVLRLCWGRLKELLGFDTVPGLTSGLLVRRI